MVIISSYGVAVVMVIITMICWGSWANTQKLSGSQKWPFQLFYWDYCLGVLILALILAFTMGSIGTGGQSFIPNLLQGSGSSFQDAFLGGVIFNAGNLMLVISIEMAGMAVAFPVCVGLALVIGVVANYIPHPVGNPTILFTGVACIVVAMIFSAMAYKKLSSTDFSADAKNKVRKGLIISIIGGILMGFFYRFVAASMSFNFEHLDVGKYSPYTAIVIFSLGIVISSFLWNSINMYKPISGNKCTYGQYFKDGSAKLHWIGIFGGIIWSIGMSFSIIASGAAGPSISYGLGQGATLIAAIWGVLIWKEFKKAPKGTNPLLVVMFAAYLIGIVLIILAKIY